MQRQCSYRGEGRSIVLIRRGEEGGQRWSSDGRGKRVSSPMSTLGCYKYLGGCASCWSGGEPSCRWLTR